MKRDMSRKRANLGESLARFLMKISFVLNVRINTVVCCFVRKINGEPITSDVNGVFLNKL